MTLDALPKSFLIVLEGLISNVAALTERVRVLEANSQSAPKTYRELLDHLPDTNS